MLAFLSRRFGQGLLSIFLLVVIVFILSRATGDPLNLLLPFDASLELRERMASQLGLDKSLPQQFFVYISDLVRGDLGTSFRHRLPVLDLFLDRFPNSLALILPAFALAFLIGIPLGVISALKRGKFLGRLTGVVGVLGMATPMFWLGLLLMFVFAVELGVLPAARMGGPSHYVLPVVTLTFFLVAGIMRLIRSSMLEVLDTEYVKFARIKGLSERTVVWKHALRNSFTAALSFAGVYFAILITGTIVIENVFAWPGVGRLLYQGILSRDYPLVQGIIIMKGALIVLVNLTIDIAYAYFDPRIRY